MKLIGRMETQQNMLSNMAESIMFLLEKDVLV